MKIAYIAIIFNNNNMKSVLNKLKVQAKAFKKYNIDIYVLSREVLDDVYLNSIQIPQYFSIKLLNEFYIRFFQYKVLDDIIDLGHYDKIILRYNFCEFSISKFIDKYPYKVITEHHTKEIPEIKKKGINSILKLLMINLEEKKFPKIAKKLYAITAVSSDFLDYEKSRIDKNTTHLKFALFGNGVSEYFENSFKKENNKKIEFIAMAGNFAQWHGIDKIAKSFNNYTKDDVFLHVVGKISDEYMNLFKRKNVKFHGYLNQAQLIKLMPKIDIAFDSLCLHTLNITSGSTLKSKFFVQHFKPIIYSTPDEDLAPLTKYFYYLDKDVDYVNIEDVKEWYKYQSSDMFNDYLNIIRNNLLWEQKVKELLNELNKD